jgi:hypothetical protein
MAKEEKLEAQALGGPREEGRRVAPEDVCPGGSDGSFSTG